MLVLSLIQSGPDKDLAGILYILLGIFLLDIVVGVIVSHDREPSVSPTERESNRLKGKTDLASFGKINK